MRVYICVDDADDLTKSTSTGKIADLIAQEIVNMGGTMDKGITRHQLLLHEDIDYTSHNSSMCMVIDIEGVEIPQMQEAAVKVIKAEQPIRPGQVVASDIGGTGANLVATWYV
ncbi:MAG: hypothetical protein ACI4KL_03225 [Lentihominibacter sp.]